MHITAPVINAQHFRVCKIMLVANLHEQLIRQIVCYYEEIILTRFNFQSVYISLKTKRFIITHSPSLIILYSELQRDL